MDFYRDKPTTLPRFVYRRLQAAILRSPEERAGAIKAAVAELTAGNNPDLRKFKFFIPDALKKVLTPEEMARLLEGTTAQREKGTSLKMVYPHVSDEFSLDQDFLASVLELGGGPVVARNGRFFTIGSCFARNVAEYLIGADYRASAFQLAEDLNSPISNAFLFGLVGQSPERQATGLARWIRLVFPDYTDAEVTAAVQKKREEVARLVDEIKSADCVVLTLGNVVDFFQDQNRQAATLLEKIFPKFIALSASEDIQVRSSAAHRLKGQGATLRLASHAETREAIECCVKGVQGLTRAPIVVTVSPVPIDSVIGLSETELTSAIEVDCVSKSRLRSALHEIIAAQAADHSLHYFPSFEMVRWVAPMLEMPSFGFDDAASRHVSSPVLNAVCALFLHKFVKFAA